MQQHPLLPKDTARRSKDAHTRTNTYLVWVDETGRDWRIPDLDAYSDYLLNEKGLAARTVAAYISAVKRQYRRLLKDSPIMFSAEQLQAVRHAIQRHTGQPEYSREVQVAHLTQDQIEFLFTRPDMTTRKGFRDTLIMGLILMTGISEAEVCRLQVKDVLRPVQGSPLRLRVTGNNRREIAVSDTFFFDEAWCADYLRQWLQVTGFEAGLLFCSFYRGGQTVRSRKLHPNAVHEMLREYTAEWGKFTALDLRRTYARRLFDNGVSVETLRENLGYTHNETVVTHIGLPDTTGHLGSDKRGSGAELLKRLNNISDV